MFSGLMRCLAITMVVLVQASVNADSLLTIVAYGDSTTAPSDVSVAESGRPFGFSSQGENDLDFNNMPHNIVNMVGQDSGKLYVYSDILRDELPGLGVAINAVDNEGIGGARTDQALWSGRINDVRAKNADIVIVQFGINDAWVDGLVQGNPSRVAIDAATQAGHPNASRGNYTDNLTEVVQILQGDDIRVILMTPNQLYPTQAQNWWMNDLLGTYAQVARDVALAENVELLDVWQIQEDYGNVPGQSIDDLLFDSMHPNGLGHQLVAQGLENIIVPEPMTLGLLGMGAMVGLKRRRQTV